jgi:hypothetical protein
MATLDIKYPDVEVQLVGASGNAGAIVGEVARALKNYGVSREEVEEFRMDAYSGDYNYLLQTAMRWVSVY